MRIRSPFRPNEAELFGRARFGVAEGEPGFAGAITPAYNTAARSFDSELALEYTLDRVTLLGAARYATNALDSGDGRAAFAGGIALRLTRRLAISGDVGGFVSPSAKTAWSVGLDFAVPAETNWQTTSYLLNQGSAGVGSKANFAAYFNRINDISTQWQIENAASADWGLDNDNVLIIDNFKIERVYATIFQGLMGQRIEDRPWKPVDPAPRRVCLGCRDE